MNLISGYIENVQSDGELAIIKVMVGEIPIKLVSIENEKSLDHLPKGKEVQLLFKETEVILATSPVESLSVSNQFKGQIVKIESGILLSKISLETKVGTLNAVISTEKCREMDLKPSDPVKVYIKINEIMIAQ